ncbi:MAG TPA: ArsA-related P-loop ATPase, partial [Jatrophihabitans sp.]|nr:ArsA-related P-loop ATPase [Jatrophihabitans sp.]
MATDERAPRLHIVTGKGGTGKTTVAGALALALARQAQRVLLVEVEGRQGLAQLFDTPPLPYSETRLAAVGGGEVVGLAVDAETAMLEYLEMFYSIKRAGSVLRKMGAIDFVTTIAPGLRDVLLTGKVKEAVIRTERGGRPSFDAVVLDAPPTGRITNFLQATYEVAGLAKMGPIHRQSQGVIELLHSDRTRVHIVTLLEEMPVQETLDA